jgi:putative Ca2+/H+ antiporter (TMEM165/GDT1 family)
VVQAASKSGKTFDRVVSAWPGSNPVIGYKPALEKAVEAFLVSTGIIALAEIGDKTQLLSLLLAARYRRPWPIIWGILIATVVNHAFAGAAGAALTQLVGARLLAWLLGFSFLAMAVWILIPDKIDETQEQKQRFGVFGTTIIAFFLAEMGDKTQIATVALAAKYAAFGAVVAGTTLGMMLANVPVVLLGNRLANRIPLRMTRAIASAIFAILGIMVLITASTTALH